jgi:hypothetical protein
MTRDELMHYAPLPEKVHQRMMQTAYYVEEEPIVKKKISLALVLVLVIVLAVCTAVAAVLLSSQQFVEQELVPRVEDGGSKKWTPEEISQIIRLADEYGVALSDEWRETLLGGQSEYPDTVIKILVRDEMGEPMDWTLEEAAWYSAMMVAIGQLDTQVNVLPAEGEISQETALALVADYVKDNYGQEIDILNETQYRRSVTYAQPVDAGVVQPRRWNIFFERLDPALYEFIFTLTPQGEITEAFATPGIRMPGIVPKVSAILQYYRDQYGSIHDFTQEIWVAIQKEVALSVKKYGPQGWLSLMLTHHQYGTPDTASLFKEEASEAARQGLIAAGLATEEVFRENSTPNALYFIHGDTPIWKVIFRDTDAEEGRTHSMLYAEVNAYTGEFRHPDRFGPGIMHVTVPYFLADVIAEYPSNLDFNTLPTAAEVIQRYQAERGSQYIYTQEEWAALRKEVEIGIAAHGQSGRDSIMIYAQQCGTPDEAAISKEDAIQAANAPGDAAALYLLHGETAAWKVIFTETDAAGAPRLCTAEVNAHTGAVSHRAPFDEVNTPWYEMYMLRAVVEEMDFIRSDNG